jgi:endonuclease YncB( thermonuclease family)
LAANSRPGTGIYAERRDAAAFARCAERSVRGVRSLFCRVALVLGLLALLAGPASADGCKLTAFGTATVRAVEDGRTAILADGRVVRLAGIEVVPGSEAALESLIAGREVGLLRLGAETDRYGRLLAVLVLPPSEGIAQSVQRVMLERGQARVAAKIGDKACADELQSAEKTARAAGLGVWADAAYVVQNAENPAGISKVRGRFAVVEGKVVSVRESGGTIYVNFGRRWSDDFTVTVLKRNERIFTSSGLDLRKLAGRTVRIRGTIEERGGPWIEATRPEQIEMTESQ